MCPVFFQSGSLIIRSWFFMFVIAIIASIYISAKIDKEQKLGIGISRIIYLHIYLALIGRFGAWLLAVFEFLLGISNNIDTTRLYGSCLAVLLVLIVAARYWHFSFYKLLDLMCLSGAIGLAFLKIGCLLNGCERGLRTQTFLSMKYPVSYVFGKSPAVTDLLLGKRWDEYLSLFTDSVSVHPAPIYLMLGLLLIFMLLYPQRKQINLNPGNLASIWLLLFGIIRILTGTIRFNLPNADGSVYFSFALSTACILVGIIGIIFRWQQHRSIFSFKETKASYDIK